MYMYRVVHNGMDIQFLSNIKEVDTFINSVLKLNSRLSPRLIYNYNLGKSLFLCYRYSTLYCEMFLIEPEGGDEFDTE